MNGRRKFSVEILISLYTEWMTALHTAKMDVVELLDAYIIIDSLETILKQHRDRDALELDDEAEHLLLKVVAQRFKRIRHTPWLYTKNTESITNQYCMRLARELQIVTGRNRFQILMPSIKNIESRITSTNLNEDTIGVTDFILTERQGYFIEIEECLRTAEMNLSLLHTQRVSPDGKAIQLNAAEKAAVLAHSQQAKELYEPIEKRHRFMREGEALGALVQQLIDGLRQGGARRKGSEMNAGADAMSAIVVFAQVVERLAPGERAWLMGLQGGGYNTFGYYWDRLSRNQEVSIAAINADQSLTAERRRARLQALYQDAGTCVEINASALESIFTSNRRALFARHINVVDIQPDIMTSHDVAVEDAWHWLRTQLLHLRSGKYKLSPTIDDAAKHDFSSKVGVRLNKLHEGQFERIIEMLRQRNTFQVTAVIEPLLQSLTPERRKKFLRSMHSLYEGKEFVSGSVGDNHTMLLTAAGQVYACGGNMFGQLGLGDTQSRNTLTLIPGLPAIAQIGAYGCNTLFLTRTGEVYACGNNVDGQLGLGDNQSRSTPTLIPGLPAIAQLTGFGNSIMYLTRAGEVYACGKNDCGQLGLGDTQNRNMPILVPGLPPIVNVSPGYDHTLFLIQTGEVYVCGNNEFGQLGLGSSVDRWNTPILVRNLPVITQVKAGYRHTVFLTGSGGIYVCGSNRAGQLGLGGLDTTRHTPTLVCDLPVISQVFAECSYTMLLTQAGTVYVSGFNCGQFGLGDTQDKSVFVVVPGLPAAITQVMASSQHVLFLTSLGTLYACGRNNDGQLGLGDQVNRVSSVIVPNEGLYIQRLLAAESAAEDVSVRVSNSSATLFAGAAAAGAAGVSQQVSHSLPLTQN